MRWPSGSGNQVAIEHCFRHGHIGKRTSRTGYLRRNGWIATAVLPLQNSRCGQYLSPMANRGDGLIGRSEMADDLQHPLIQTDVLRCTATRDNERVIVLWSCILKGSVQREVVAAFFGV